MAVPVATYVPLPYAPTDRYVPNGRLIDLIRAQGQDAANAQLRSGEIQANMWGNIGNTIQGTTAQIIKQQQDAPRLAAEKSVADVAALKAGEAHQLAAGQGQVDTMMQGGQPLPPGASGPVSPSYLDENGLWDIPKMNAALAQSGMAHLAPDLLKPAENLNESIAKSKQQQEQTANTQTVLVGDLSHAALVASDKLKIPLLDAMDMVSQSALKAKQIQPQQYAQVRSQIAALQPDQQISALTGFMDLAAKIAPTKTLGKDALEHDRYDRLVASNVVPEKPTEASLAADAATLGTPQETPTAAVSARAIATLKPKPNTTAEQDDARYRAIQSALIQKQPVPADDQAWASAYEKQKTLGVDTTASAAALRQAVAIAAQTAQQARAQKFTESQAGRSELTTKVEQPYLDAGEKADTLRTVVDAAKNGNLQAAAVQSLLGTLGIVTTEGVKRINSTELAQTAGAGSLLDRIKGAAGKVTAGQPVDAKLQDDLQQLAGLLEQSAYTKYLNAQKATTKRYGLTDEVPLPGPTAPKTERKNPF